MEKNLWVTPRALTEYCPNTALLAGVYGPNRIPVLFAENIFRKDNVIYAYARMPYKQKLEPRSIFSARTNEMYEVKQLRHATVSMMSDVTYWELFNTLNHVDSKTFVFDDIKHFINTLGNVNDLMSKYKFGTRIDTNDNYSAIIRYKKQNFNIKFAITLFSFESFCPIYNPSAVDGMGIAIEIIDATKSDKRGKLCIIQNSYHIVSNYKDNVFYMDGMKIQEHTTDPNIDFYIGTYKTVESSIAQTDSAVIKCEDFEENDPYQVVFSRSPKVNPLFDEVTNTSTSKGEELFYFDIEKIRKIKVGLDESYKTAVQEGIMPEILSGIRGAYEWKTVNTYEEEFKSVHKSGISIKVRDNEELVDSFDAIEYIDKHNKKLKQRG